MNAINIHPAWRAPLGCLVVSLLALTVLYLDSFKSMVHVWENSETFAHCYFILPISLWLIWRKRAALAQTKPQANYWFSPLLLLLGLGWLIAAYAGIQVVQHLAVVAMIQVIVVILLGWQITRIILFPLVFLLFSVPVGEELIPYLINFTADFSVASIKSLGIPVYQEGTYIQLPTGNWSVVKACSGVRYLIASAVLGILYAYLNYTKRWKQMLFFLVSLIVPIIANGLRAVMIILIGHFSGMTLATGVDHLIYGWLFFGLVVAIMFYVGSFFTDPLENESSSIVLTIPAFGNPPATATYILHSLVIVFMIALWPGKYYLDQQVDPALPSVVKRAAFELPGWRITDKLTSWRPSYQNLDAEQVITYERKGKRVMLYLGYYHKQRQDAELVNYSNVLVKENDHSVRLLKKPDVDMVVAGHSVSISRYLLKTASDSFDVLPLFYVHDKYTTGNIEVKLAQIKARLMGTPGFGVLVVVLSEQEEGMKAAGQMFLEQAAPHIKRYIESRYE